MLYWTALHGLCKLAGSSSHGHLSAANRVHLCWIPPQASGKTIDPGLQAAIACVKNDAGTEEGKCCKFEATATFLIPNCPVTRRRDMKKHVSGEINEANVEEMPQAEVAAFGNKPSIRKTGVHL